MQRMFDTKFITGAVILIASLDIGLSSAKWPDYPHNPDN